MNPPSCTISGDKYAAGSRLHRIGCWIRDSRPVDSPFETKLFLLGPGQAPGGVPRNEVRATATAHHLAAEAFQPKRQRLQALQNIRFKLGPVASVLFRPEEVHVRSPIGAAW